MDWYQSSLQPLGKILCADAIAERVVFANPYQDKDVTQTIYLAR